jgi:predicted unusual protein kinase regulating ubiquinone biosynthesis (AarF/ABC1/UbiB family)
MKPHSLLKPRNTPLRIVRFIGEARLRFVFQKDKGRVGQWLKTEMTSLGPAFIKLGQFLSTRTDIFEKEIVAELSKLQDDIHPEPYEDIVRIIDTSLGTRSNEIFQHIDPTPMASASIGQVHKARLKNTNKDVVIKIQKPHVAQQIRNDLATLRNIARLAVGMQSPRATEINNILGEYERFLSAELDYTQELAHMKRFSEILDESEVIVPAVYEDLSFNNMLVMEYVPSIKISDISQLNKRGYDLTVVADTLVNVFLHMIIKHGYVHCDPHPGNIGVSLDDESTIVLYDFGNVIELSQEFRSQLNNMIFAIYQKDVDEFVELLIRLNILQVASEGDVLDVKAFFSSFFVYLESLDFQALKQSVTSSSSAGAGASFKINPDFLSLFRVFSLLDGTCARLDPKFNYITALTPFVENIMMDFSFFDYRARKDLQKLQNYPRIITNTDQNLARLDKRMRELTDDQEFYRNMFIGMVVLYQIQEPLALAFLAPLIAVIVFMRRRS